MPYLLTTDSKPTCGWLLNKSMKFFVPSWSTLASPGWPLSNISSSLKVRRRLRIMDRRFCSRVLWKSNKAVVPLWQAMKNQRTITLSTMLTCLDLLLNISSGRPGYSTVLPSQQERLHRIKAVKIYRDSSSLHARWSKSPTPRTII